ncbi:hypothetical protein C9374_013834 [Naegleria lovaniensis]|uniref:Uncharacterized protein n=1 Tax=Naegleria lovaniensis TaxID=51637 RepID=A0AA88KPM2_NAELO|nr:uncharacterized protein C9374_013834 [Naegleria lovaniensis]KAG2389274.1 hypothetical protein C9374_013834 [Naegleria lovaniensis]
MCWSLTASMCFTMLGAIMTTDQIRRTLTIPKELRDRSYSQVLFFLAYTAMEFLQFLQYCFGIEGTCGSTSNVTLSIVAHFLIWTQPIVHNYWCLKNTAKGRKLFRYALCCSILTLVVATVCLIMGYFHVGGFGVSTNGFDPVNGTPGNILGIEIQNVNSKLCSMQGPNHLYWMFPYHPLWGHGISWYVWILLAGFPHFFRYSVKDNDFFGKSWVMGSAVVGGWLVALVVSLMIGTFHETPSYWCLISVPCLALPYICAFVKPQRFIVREELYVQGQGPSRRKEN